LTENRAEPGSLFGREDDHAQPAGSDRYREIYEAIALPVLVIDHETWCVVAVNEAALAQYGYTREEFVGLPILNVRPPEGRAEALEVLSAMPHGFWKTTAVQHQRKDGSVFNADVWSRDTILEGRGVRIATISDVTDRVLLQQELQQAQKMEAIGRLAGGIAHDFNNALTAIAVNAELLMERVAHDEVASADMAEIRSAADRAGSLVRQLLAYSRQQVMRTETVPLHAVVSQSEELLRRTLSPRVELRSVLDGSTWPVRVDPVQLEQVILNLAVNAQDAMPDGGTLTLSTRNLWLPRDTAMEGVTIPAGDYAELIARDTGIGMEEVVRARIFDPFFTTKPPPEGTGLGLSMAYGIVRQSGGYITVASEPGRGSSFRILLPRAGAVSPTSAV